MNTPYLIRCIRLGVPAFTSETTPRRSKRVRGSRLWKRHHARGVRVATEGETNFARKARLAQEAV